MGRSRKKKNNGFRDRVSTIWLGLSTCRHAQLTTTSGVVVFGPSAWVFLDEPLGSCDTPKMNSKHHLFISEDLASPYLKRTGNQSV
ncbi:hypothetical protein RRG08_001467 [Elysia crispata]|uniref:Uncharacterized protein n=1 Tax=Elysia crispata TaxID=231223 RepID=A0AAE0ZQT5_9GAST|nr:hypothetical protein RRG08_001467 [Elysia crispata]